MVFGHELHSTGAEDSRAIRSNPLVCEHLCEVKVVRCGSGESARAAIHVDTTK